MTIPIIDIFAGPGGLGEGFSRFTTPSGAAAFRIKLSVEKDQWAHRTLLLRSFYRQFCQVPDEYYEYLRGTIDRNALFDKFPIEARNAQCEAMQAELGNSAQQALIDQKLSDAIPKTPWVLIGGPPCQVYSVIGRSRMQGNPDTFLGDKRHLLYEEYLKIIATHSPAVFVFENVKGILSSKAGVRDGQRAMFDQIRSDLERPGIALANSHAASVDLRYRIYSLVVPTLEGKTLRPNDYVLKCENYGIPQCRHRVILLGVRSDIDVVPGLIPDTDDAPNVKHMIGDLPRLRSTISKQSDSAELWADGIRQLETMPEFDKIDNKVKTKMVAHMHELDSSLSAGAEWTDGNYSCSGLGKWMQDDRLHGVCNHTARSHMMSDLHRYLFVSSYAEVYNLSPQTQHFPHSLLPAHKNVESGDFDDRFRVQVADRPATTITSHISKDGHYHIHYDPQQCRSLTVREAARIQTFPDNYFFEGPRTQQYQQVGNAVPPLLAYKIADIVYKLFVDADLIVK